MTTGARAERVSSVGKPKAAAGGALGSLLTATVMAMWIRSPMLPMPSRFYSRDPGCRRRHRGQIAAAIPTRRSPPVPKDPSAPVPRELFRLPLD